ncbi:alpha/beta fold hydrolase [Kutzneria albida]|uniref:Alpha/beta hydrolase fold protein n=1 Tax=Kutzneria albida DSM 43870 TaxID=1449976 RepID=W5W8F0_9PSEU|nr:alpha/beta hydrolase [Kutzneria albida]AHH97172.1 alpha/beta hydrolase fold protein [Kutzneria albida DSM 43870]
MSEKQTTVVLVHGAFADASSWSVVVSGLRERGVPVLAVANELRGGASDGARVAALVREIDGPVLLVGHSYGGVVITEAASRAENVVGLVYVTAFALKEGEAVQELLSHYPDSSLGAALVPHELPGQDVVLSLREDAFGAVFAADLPAERTSVLAVSQRPIAAAAFGEKAGPAAWRTLPSHYLVATADQAIHPQAQRGMAERIGATVREVDASHAVAVSRPDAVLDLIDTALKVTR